MDTDASSLSENSQDHERVRENSVRSSSAKRKKVSPAVVAARGSIPPLATPSPNAARKGKTKAKDLSGDNEKENSLGTVTKRFMEVAEQYPSGLLELNDIATQLGVSKRRMYDITNVLEGINLVEKQSKNVVLWKTGAPLTEEQRTKITALRREMDRAHQLEKKLDASIGAIQHSIYTYLSLPTCYVHHSDVRGVPYLNGQMILAVKAAKGAQVAMDPAPGQQKLTLRSDTEVDVYVLTTDQEMDATDEASSSVAQTPSAVSSSAAATPNRSNRASQNKATSPSMRDSTGRGLAGAGNGTGGAGNGGALPRSPSSNSNSHGALLAAAVNSNSMDATPTLAQVKREPSDPTDLLVQIADTASNQAPIPVGGAASSSASGGHAASNSGDSTLIKSSPNSNSNGGALLPPSPISPTRGGGLVALPLVDDFAFTYPNSPTRGSPVHKPLPLPLATGLLSPGATPSSLLSTMTSPSPDGGASYLDESTQPGMLNHNALRIRSEHSNDTSPFKPARRSGHGGWGITTPEVSSTGFDDYLEGSSSPVKGSFALSPTSSPEKRHFGLGFNMPDGMESQDGFTFFAESSIGLPAQSHR